MKWGVGCGELGGDEAWELPGIRLLSAKGSIITAQESSNAFEKKRGTWTLGLAWPAMNAQIIQAGGRVPGSQQRVGQDEKHS